MPTKDVRARRTATTVLAEPDAAELNIFSAAAMSFDSVAGMYSHARRNASSDVTTKEIRCQTPVQTTKPPSRPY